MAASMPAAHASWRRRGGEEQEEEEEERRAGFNPLPRHVGGKNPYRRERPHLSVVQVAEASDDLLLVQLVGLQLHASDALHDAVILQALIPGQLRRLRGAALQTVHVAFLPDRRDFRSQKK